MKQSIPTLCTEYSSGASINDVSVINSDIIYGGPLKYKNIKILYFEIRHACGTINFLDVTYIESKFYGYKMTVR